MRQPCPSCPDGNEWNSNGPTGRTCKTCNGKAYIGDDEDEDRCEICGGETPCHCDEPENGI